MVCARDRKDGGLRFHWRAQAPARGAYRGVARCPPPVNHPKLFDASSTDYLSACWQDECGGTGLILRTARSDASSARLCGWRPCRTSYSQPATVCLARYLSSGAQHIIPERIVPKSDTLWHSASGPASQQTPGCLKVSNLATGLQAQQAQPASGCDHIHTLGAQDAARRGHPRAWSRRPEKGGGAGGEPGRRAQKSCGPPLHTDAGAQLCLDAHTVLPAAFALTSRKFCLLFGNKVRVICGHAASAAVPSTLGVLPTCMARP